MSGGARELEEYVDLREDAEELELTGNNPDEEEEEVVASPFGEGGNQGDDDEDIPGIGHCVLSIERKVKVRMSIDRPSCGRRSDLGSYPRPSKVVAS